METEKECKEVEINLEPGGQGSFIVNGVDIAERCTGIDIKIRVGKLPEITMIHNVVGGVLIKGHAIVHQNTDDTQGGRSKS